MTPRWTTHSRPSMHLYDLVAQIWAADIYRLRHPDPQYYEWALLLSDAQLDQFGFSTDQVEYLFKWLEDRWLGHLPDGFEDQVRAVVALYQH